jgi:hypothetical protein
VLLTRFRSCGWAAAVGGAAGGSCRAEAAVRAVTADRALSACFHRWRHSATAESPPSAQAMGSTVSQRGSRLPLRVSEIVLSRTVAAG